MKTRNIIKVSFISIFIALIFLGIGLLVWYCVVKVPSEVQEFIVQGEVDTKDVNLSSKITGRVSKINVVEGAFVKKGDVLIELEIPDYLAKQKQAKANLDLAKKLYERNNKLKKTGAVSIQEFDNSYAAMIEAENKYKEISSYVDERIIRAPISGQVKEISVEESELIGAGYPIITMIDTTNCWVVFNLREDLLSKIKMGTEFSVTIPARNNVAIPVKVDFISAMGNYTTWRATKVRGDFDLKTFEIHARPITANEELIAGMSALVDWNKLEVAE